MAGKIEPRGIKNGIEKTIKNEGQQDDKKIEKRSRDDPGSEGSRARGGGRGRGKTPPRGKEGRVVGTF